MTRPHTALQGHQQLYIVTACEKERAITVALKVPGWSPQHARHKFKKLLKKPIPEQIKISVELA